MALRRISHSKTIEGFSTIEVLIALMVLSTMLIAATLLTLGTPGVLQNTRDHYEARALAEAILMREERRMSEAFSSISSHSTSTVLGFRMNFNALLLPDEATKRLTATVDWEGLGGTRRTLSITEYITNYLHPSEYSCDILPRGTWNVLTSTTYALVPGDRFPIQWSWGSAATDEIAATREYVALSAAKTNVGNAPSFFLFSLQDGEPRHVSSLPTSSTTAAVADIALTTTYGYIASASTCAVISRCGQVKIIDISDPLRPRIISQLLLSRTTPPYAGDTIGPVPAKSIRYRNGYLYLGLEQTPTALGQEFNVIDVRDPFHPTWIGGYRVGRTVNDIAVRDGYAYLATNARGVADVIILDVSNPSNIKEVAKTGLLPKQQGSTFGYAHVLGLYGSELHIGRSYISNGDEWVLIDSGDMALPVSMSRDRGTVLSPVSIRALILRESQALLLMPHALEVWDRANPSDPKRTTSLSIAAEATDALCIGNDIYVVATHEGVGQIVRIGPL